MAKRKVFGVGINNAGYRVEHCPIYAIWKGMIRRCYSPYELKRRPTYTACTVVQEWLYFASFREWALTQDWTDKHLDKDILVPGNREYSPHTCCFVLPQINNLLVTRRFKRGEYPLGVSKYGKRYQASLSIGGKQGSLGYFNTVSEASQVYNVAKAANIRRVADTQSELVKKGLYLHAEMYESGEVK